MLDNLLTNKYICIALVIALLVLLYMYSQKKSCGAEGMDNVDLTPLAQELVEKPWSNWPGADDHKHVGNYFDKFADKYTREKLIREGYHPPKYLKRSDQYYRDYMENYGKIDDDEDGYRPYHDQYMEEYEDYTIPRPLDDRPDLSQCQPCRCDDRPKDKSNYRSNYKSKGKKMLRDSEEDLIPVDKKKKPMRTIKPKKIDKY